MKIGWLFSFKEWISSVFNPSYQLTLSNKSFDSETGKIIYIFKQYGSHDFVKLSYADIINNEKIIYSINPINLMDIHLNEYIEKVGTEEYKITEYLKGNRYKISNRYFEETYSGDNICKHVEMFNKLAAPDLCKIAYTSGFLNGRKFSSKIKNEIEKSKIIDYSHYKNVIKLEKNNR